MAYVAAHHARPLTLGEVATHTMTSTRQLQRVLGGEGTCFRRLLLRARMAHAVKLLQTDMPVGEVARAVGYVEPARFSKAFRGCFGCSPSAWRKRPRAPTPSARASLPPPRPSLLPSRLAAAPLA